MSAVVGMVARVASVIPLTVLTLGLVFMIVVAVIWPTPRREKMVGCLGGVIRDLARWIASRPA